MSAVKEAATVPIPNDGRSTEPFRLAPVFDSDRAAKALADFLQEAREIPERIGVFYNRGEEARPLELAQRDILRFLDYVDGTLDRADPVEIIGKIVSHLRRVRPQVVITFGLDGAYGHPYRIAISQFTTAAVNCAADPSYEGNGNDERSHRVSKLYYMAWPRDTWDIYQETCRTLTSTVDGVVRQAVPWPDWSLTTRIDARPWWRRVWWAVQRHETQMSVYGALTGLDEARHESLWGNQTFYRAFSAVNGGRKVETDLFQGLRAVQPLEIAI